LKEINVLKKNILRLLAALMAMTLLVATLAGCRKDQDNAYVPPEFVYVPEFTTLPDDIADIRNLSYYDGKLFFSSQIILDEETWTTETRLYSMDVDGTNFAELANYSFGLTPPNSAEGYTDIVSLTVDSSGALWITETGSFYTFDLPENFEGEDYERWEFYQDLGTLVSVRKLDNTGNELLTVDISSISTGSDYFYVSAFNIDGDGNIYIGASENIYVLNNTGNVLFKLDLGNWVDQLVRMPDDTVAFFGWMEEGYVLRKIDPAARNWGATVELPHNAYSIYQGGGDYSIIFNDNTSLFGIDANTNESIRLLNWIESNVMLEGLGNINILPDGRIMCTNQTWDRITGDYSFELIILTKTPYSDLPERIVLTFATVWLDWGLRSHIVQFNRSNPEYRIHVIDYSEFNTEDDWQVGQRRLSTDIISGKVPDILDVSSLPFKQYVARDLLEDLYPFIDSDQDFNRSDFVESAFRAAEMDGGLYRVFPSFSVNTLIGHPSVLGEGMGWNMDEFKAVLDANPQADMPLGQWFTKDNFLQTVIMLGMDEYVDWVAGEVHFDTGEFAQMLEFANRFPDEIDYGDMDFYYEMDELIATGRQIMMPMGISDFNQFQMFRAMFGGEIVFKGFPTESRNGNSLYVYAGTSITTRSPNKDAAWQFIRTTLLKDWQLANVWDFPTNKAAFDEKVHDAMSMNEDEVHMASWGRGDGIEMTSLTQDDIDQLMELIDSTSGIASQDEALMNIITESAADYFGGRGSAQDAARIIQNRATTYINEQS